MRRIGFGRRIGAAGGSGLIVTRWLTAAVVVLMLAIAAQPALAVEAVNVRLDASAIDLTAATQLMKTETDRIQVSTAPGPDGIVRRIEVRARERNTNWAVFALTNNSDEQIDRLIVVPHYRMVGSGLFWPDLGLSRVVAITPSSGDRPLRQESTSSDIFRITLDPGTVITLVAELRTDKLPQIYLWEPDAYKDKVNSFTLYYGIVIGIAGLLALFLTILFVVKGSIMFPAAAALGWAVLVYIGIDFGFWGKVFDMSAGAERIWRACGEAILSATLLVFLFAYLNLSRWHVRYAHITIAWLTALAALIGVAVFDPAVASGIARMSLALIAVFGLALVIYLSTHGFDRAVLLIPTWLLLVVWTAGAGLAVVGVVTNDIIAPALLGGLVLIVMLIGFTVMQHAFAGGITHGIVSDVERRALALTGAGDMIWDWDVSADKVYTSPETEHILGLKRGALEGSAASWLDVLHPLDRDRFRTSLDSAVEQRRGRLTQDFRLHAADGHYVWFTLKARPVVGSDGEVVRLVGTLTDVSDIKKAEERLMFDAVHDNLTGLPNRELFIDRMEAAFAYARSDPQIRPSVLVIDLDRFKQVNDSVGIAVGDSVLLTIARRLARLLKPQDTLARLVRQPVRADPDVGEGAGAHRRLHRDVAPDFARADRLQRPRNLHHRLDRAGARRAAAAPHRGGAQRRRARDVSRQAHRRRPHRDLQAGHALAQDRPADHRIGIAPRHRARGDQGALPADRAAGGSRHRRLRGAGALGSSQDGPPVAGRIHLDRRGNRPDRRPRPVHARSHRAPARHLAGRQSRARADHGQRQRVIAAIAAPRPDPGSAQRAGALDAGARHASSWRSPSRW